MKKIIFLLASLVSLSVVAQTNSTVKMNQFVNTLLRKMTISEKIGQLNLLTPGGSIVTGAVVSNDVEKK